MTPQLFINYKLKSVAHLPWRMLTYKALNTFIDDMFAFVIKMPTMYRIGCFRDGKHRRVRGGRWGVGTQVACLPSELTPIVQLQPQWGFIHCGNPMVLSLPPL